MALVLQHTLRRLARQSGRHAVRLFHDEFSKPSPVTVRKGNPNKPAVEPRVPAAGSIANKYEVFRDMDATVILDVEEERQLQLQQNLEEGTAEAEPQPSNALPSVFSGINLQREL